MDLLFLAQVAAPAAPLGLVHLLVAVLIFGLIFSVLWWAISQVPLPSPFAQIARVILVLIVVIVLIDLLWPYLAIR